MSECRRCSECVGCDHHWLENGDFGADEDDPDYLEDEYRQPTGNMYICKRCPAVGDDCAYCHGSGEVGDYYAPCFECGGAGVVAAAPKRFADLGDGGDA
jgi:hypothetical protein